MPDKISGYIDTFSNFLSENEKKFKHQQGAIISYALPVDEDFNQSFLFPGSLIKTSTKAFYFESPEESFAFTGINECISVSENGISRFSLTDKKTKQWKDKIFSNHEILKDIPFPLFMGGMKFSAEHPDDTWHDYDDSAWFIPELLLIKKEEKKYLVYSFLLKRWNDVSQLIEKYKKWLNDLLSVPVQSESPVIRQNLNDLNKDKKKWKILVSKGLDDILDQKADKIVYSRKAEYLLSSEPDYTKVINYFRTHYKSCYTFIFRQGKSVFFGASPERLAKFTDGRIEIDSLAGSAPRGRDSADDEKIASDLLLNKKNLNEHNIVTSHILNIIGNFSGEVNQGSLSVKKLPNIQHLLTRISAKLKNEYGMFSILNELFPTPAVCGKPKKTALELIRKNEIYNRGLYSGFIGWFNLNNEGDFIVSIRSALSKGTKLFAFAGNGIVADSDPEEEFKETELKLKPILSVFTNEN